MTETSEMKRTSEYWARLRSYVQHEDNLINYRLTWILTIEGFLFAAFGIILAQKLSILRDAAEVEDAAICQYLVTHVENIRLLDGVICVSGSLISAVGYAMINDAGDAINALRADWEKYLKTKNLDEIVLYPFIIRGDGNQTIISQTLNLTWIPKIFCLFWLFYLFYSVQRVDSATHSLSRDQTTLSERNMQSKDEQDTTSAICKRDNNTKNLFKFSAP